jgi:Ca2+-binding EF-hand superfamily protein
MLGVTLLAAPALAQFPGGGGGMGGGMGGGSMGGGGMGGHHRGGGGMSGERGEHNWQAAAIKPIKRADFDARVREEFAAADLDHNGLVTLQEVHAARDARLAKLIDERFARIDSNQDGTISHDEFVAWQKQMGSPEAADQFMAEEDDRNLAEARAGGAGGHRHFGHDDDIGGFLIAPVDANLLVNADLNHDLALSLAEDLTWQDARFDAADGDHDGTLSADEIRALREKMIKARP